MNTLGISKSMKQSQNKLQHQWYSWSEKYKNRISFTKRIHWINNNFFLIFFFLLIIFKKNTSSIKNVEYIYSMNSQQLSTDCLYSLFLGICRWQVCCSSSCSFFMIFSWCCSMYLLIEIYFWDFCFSSTKIESHDMYSKLLLTFIRIRYVHRRSSCFYFVSHISLLVLVFFLIKKDFHPNHFVCWGIYLVG